jgi:hypothetical protein
MKVSTNMATTTQMTILTHVSRLPATLDHLDGDVVACWHDGRVDQSTRTPADDLPEDHHDEPDAPHVVPGTLSRHVQQATEQDRRRKPLPPKPTEEPSDRRDHSR